MIPRIRIAEVNGVALMLFGLCTLAGLAVSQAIHQPAAGVIGIMAGLYFLFAIKVVRQWEKVAVLRLGRTARPRPLPHYSDHRNA